MDNHSQYCRLAKAYALADGHHLELSDLLALKIKCEEWMEKHGIDWDREYSDQDANPRVSKYIHLTRVLIPAKQRMIVDLLRPVHAMAWGLWWKASEAYGAKDSLAPAFRKLDDQVCWIHETLLRLVSEADQETLRQERDGMSEEEIKEMFPPVPTEALTEAERTSVRYIERWNAAAHQLTQEKEQTVTQSRQKDAPPALWEEEDREEAPDVDLLAAKQT